MPEFDRNNILIMDFTPQVTLPSSIIATITALALVYRLAESAPHPASEGCGIFMAIYRTFEHPVFEPKDIRNIGTAYADVLRALGLPNIDGLGEPDCRQKGQGDCAKGRPRPIPSDRESIAHAA